MITKWATGTAIKDSISDIYEVADWLSPNTLPARYKFDQKYRESFKHLRFTNRVL